jgi:hypothetical protein
MAAFNTPAIPLPSVVVVPNNETVAGTLSVTGAALFSSNLGVSGTLGANGATSLYSTLNVTGATALASTLGVTGVTTVAAGSAAAPSVVSVTGTADTGVFFPAADTVAASTAGSERLRIDSSGNFGIGTTSPVARLDVAGGSYPITANINCTNSNGTLPTIINSNGPSALAISANRSGGQSELNLINTNYGATSTGGIWFEQATGAASVATRMIIDKDGKVGIGTTSPAVKLQVTDAGATASEIARFVGNSGNNFIKVSDDNGATGANFGAIAGGNFYLFTNGYGAVYGGSSERMRITAAGNVGIGTTIPVYQLQVLNDSAGKPGVGGLWTVVSDERIKTDIVPADLDRCYEIVKSVPLKHFGFKPGVYTDEQIQDKHSLGWIAQDVQAVFEKAVSVKPFTIHTPQSDGTVKDEVIDDCLDLNSGQMIAALYGCVQALMAKVEALEARG